MNRKDMECLSDLYPCLAKKLSLSMSSRAANEMVLSQQNTHSARSSINTEENFPTVISSFNNDNINSNQIGGIDKSYSVSSNIDKGSGKNNIRSNSIGSKGGKGRSRRNSNDDMNGNFDEKILKKDIEEKSSDEKKAEEEENKACKLLPFMIDSLSPRTCVQLAMLLCTNKYVQLML